MIWEDHEMDLGAIHPHEMREAEMERKRTQRRGWPEVAPGLWRHPSGWQIRKDAAALRAFQLVSPEGVPDRRYGFLAQAQEAGEALARGEMAQLAQPLQPTAPQTGRAAVVRVA